MIKYLQGYCVSLEEALAVSLFPKVLGTELIRKSSCSYPANEWPFFYYERAILATHTFKFNCFLQDRNGSKEIS